jgi:PAS domain S-box-containing protein
VNGKTIGFQAIIVDITERRRSEERLLMSEERYRCIFENTSDGLLYLDESGRILEANRKAVEIYGGRKKELLEKRFTELGVIHPEDVPRLVASIARIFAGREGTTEISIRNKKGEDKLLECTSSLLRIGDKNNGMMVSVRDVTESKRAEQTIRESQQKFERLFVDNPEAAVYWDSDFRVLNINPRFTRLFGYSLNEAKGKRNVDIIIPKDRIEESELLGKMAKEGYVDFDTVRKKKDGSLIHVSLSVAPMIIESKLVGYMGLYKDITERKKMEERLKQYSEHLEELVEKKTNELLELEKRYSVLVEEANDGVAIIQDERIVFLNKKAPNIIGYTREEAIGLPFEAFLDGNYRQRTKELCQRKMRGEAISPTLEIEWTTKTGEHIPVELSATLINYQGCPAILAIIRDISERKRIEEQHVKLEKFAIIGELATMIAHDLRNPLTSIRNASFYIKGGCRCRKNPGRKNVLEMLDIIEQETLFANNIINDLLDFAAKRPLQRKKLNINKIIEGLLVKSNIPENIETQKNLAERTTAAVDEKQLERVFLNVTKNAIQAMPNGGKLVVTTTKTKDYIEIAFTDTGTGIAEENISRIFTPFFTTKAKGIGLGLAICKRIVEEHGGTIGFKSKVGQGTTFTIILPKKKEESNL